MRLTRFLCLFLLTLSACHPAPPTPRETAETPRPYLIDVARVRVIDSYRSQEAPPHVESLASPLPAEAAKRWNESRFQATGSSGVLEIEILDAGIVHRSLPKQETGMRGWLTEEQTELYEGSMTISYKLYDGARPLPSAEIQLSARASRSLREKASEPERQTLYHNLTVDLLRQIGIQLDAQIRTYMGNHLQATGL
jgi:hypothetical protein